MCLRDLFLLLAMGSRGSFMQREDDDVLGTEYDSSQGVVKSIPNEVKPRPKIGGGVRSGRSMSKQKNGSLRSALSVDMESAEAEKIRKDYEMYRLNKENEMASLRKKEQKLETENRRLRAELQAKEKSSQKQREERDAALEAEHRALMRAAAIESDRDKIQHLFKIFRETKESELRNLLKAKQDLEIKLSRLGGSAFEDAETTSRLEHSGGFGNHGDWWATLDSEPSVASLSHLHRSALYHGPEFMQHSIVDPDGLYVNINKDDWLAATATLANMIPESLLVNRVVVYVTATPDVESEVDAFCESSVASLRLLCTSDGRLLSLVKLPSAVSDDAPFGAEKQINARCRSIDQSTVYVAFVGSQMSRFVEMDINYSQLKCRTTKQAIYCFLEVTAGQESSEDLQDLKSHLLNGTKTTVLSCSDINEGIEQIYSELKQTLEHLSDKKDLKGTSHLGLNLEEPLLNWGTSVLDPLLDYEQRESFRAACQSTCELGFEKYYERLSAHVSAAGPLPPLLISGTSGSGKSLLLAKWIELQQCKSASGSFLLYHFVDSPSSCSADPVLMIRRLTSQLMDHVSSPTTLTCDDPLPMDEFSKWLEKVSSRVPSGIVLVIDSMDRFRKAETHLKWLMDPLPVDLRVIVSAHPDHCPPAWKSWPALVIDEMNPHNVKDLLRAELSTYGASLSTDHENRILTHCLTASTRAPLYLTLLTGYIARCYSDRTIDADLDHLLSASDAVHLYEVIIGRILCECGASDYAELLEAILLAIYSSRNGVSESELFGIFDLLTWSFWCPLSMTLVDYCILRFRSGLLVFAHEQAREAVTRMFLSENGAEKMQRIRRLLLDYHSQFSRSEEVTCRTADERLWLSQQLDYHKELDLALSNLSIFVKLFIRGRCFEILSYWQYLGDEKTRMAQAFLAAAKKLEDDSRCEGHLTLTSVADVYEGIGRFFMNHSNVTEALNPLQRSLELRETSLDPDHPMIARSLHYLALLHERQGKLTTAEQLYRQAIEIYEDSLGKDHVLVAREIDMLGVLFQKQGKHGLAEPMHKRSISIRKKCRGPLLAAMTNKSSETLRQKVLELGDLSLGPPTLELARTLNEVGVLHYLQSNFEASEALLVRSLEIRESILKDDHPDLAQSLNNLAALYNDRKQHEKAALLYERALEIRQKLFPIEHPGVTSITKNLGILYKKTGQLEKAEPFYRRLVEAKERAFGLCHPTVATAIVNLAVLHSQMGNHSAAEPLYERALNIYEDTLDPCHPRVSETLTNMALLKYEQGDFETAAKLYKRSMEIKDNETLSNGTVSASTLAPTQK